MDTQELFNACHRKLREAGQSVEESARKCVKYVSENNRQTKASLGRLSVSTHDSRKGWFIVLIILILICIGVFLGYRLL